jgi:Carboxypeptidase regulatory-like domain
MRRFLSALSPFARFLFATAVNVVTVIAVSLSLVAQTAPSPGKAEQHPAPPCVVSGRVVTAAEGNPLKSVWVSLVASDMESRTRPYATTTDSEGHFLLKDIVPGRYRFFATRAGFVDQPYQARGNGQGALLSLKSGETVSDVLFRMTVSGVITGRVTNEEGEAMVRIKVVALRGPSEEEMDEDEAQLTSRTRQLRAVSSAQTDDRGQYRIFGLKPGEYYIKATDAFEPDRNVSAVPESYWVQASLGSEYGTAYYPGVPQASQAQVILVKPGDEAQADVFMQRARTAEIAGHVIGRDGPARKAWVELEQSGVDDIGIERQDTSDEKGAFRIKGVPPGSYTIAVLEEEEAGFYESRGKQKLEVNGENIDSLIISPSAGASFEGRVTVAGAGPPALDQLNVEFYGVAEDEQLFGNGRVKKDGTFEIKSISVGNYSANITGLENDWYVKSMRLGSDEILEKGLQVEKGGPGGRLEVVIASGSAQLEGSVKDPDGAAMGARVRIVPEPETVYNRLRAHSVNADQSGHFTMRGLVPGKYRLRAKYSASSDSGPLRSDPQIVTLSEREHKTIELTLVKPPAE